MTGTAAEVIGIASVDEVVFPRAFADSIGGQLAERYHALVTQTPPPGPLPSGRRGSQTRADS